MIIEKEMKEQFEVVISGISGSFPNCIDPQELEENIYNYENMVSDTGARWRSTDVSRKIGAIKNSIKFDDTFFGIHRKLTIIIDPHAKQTFEKTFEAICDAGRNPIDFYNSNTAIIASSGINETEGENMMDWKHIGHLIIGYSRCMQSNRVSYAFNFTGPSVTIVSSWEGGITALEMARSLIAKGHIRQAVVAGTNIIHYPQIARQFQALGKLNEDGMTKCFSADADGYSRSDSAVSLFLQRSEDAFRSYGTLVKAMTRSEMRNSYGILDPNGLRDFMGEFYADAPIKAEDVAFVQADGCASLKIDAMELDAISEVLCQGRSKPLPVTSIKSKLGHAEGASSLVSVIGALIALKTGYIPPVLHYTKPNPLASSLKDGKIKVVTEKTPLEGDYVAVSAIGLCSTFGHVLIKRNPKCGKKVDPDYFPADGIPRLFLLSGRDDVIMKKLLQEVEDSPIDDNLYLMNHMLFRKGFPKHLYRGYSLKSQNKQHSQVKPYPGGEKLPVWFIFSGMGSQWSEMGKGIMAIPIMKRSIERCHKALEPKGLDLINIITSNDPTIYDNILHCFVGIAAIQIALVDLLEALGIKADGYVGHSVGELGCGYADKCFTAEEMLLAAYARGRASNEANLIKGMMAAVGKGYIALKNDLPEGVEIACHNSATSCTLSGPTEQVKNYVQKLKDQGTFAKLVNVANIPYHSKHIAPAAPLLLNYLKEILPEPKMRSSKWISSSIPKSRWDTDLAKYCSAEYHTNNLLSYVLFEEAVAHVPKNAICIEIAPHGLLQAIVKKSLPTCTHIPLTNRAKEGAIFTIEALALAFCNGIDIDLSKLYPSIEFPLPRETPCLQRYITWNHSEDWEPISLERNLENLKKNRSHKDMYLFSQPDEIYQLSINHRISGNTVYPLVNLLKIMMDYMEETLMDSLNFKSYEIDELKVFNSLILDRTNEDKLRLLYQIGSGHFEVVFDETALAAGLIYPVVGSPDKIHGFDTSATANGKEILHLSEEEIYQFFEEKECFFHNEYRNITEIKIFDNAFIGKVKWCGNTEYYLDAITKLIMLYHSTNCDRLMEIDSIGQLIFTPSLLPNENGDVYVYYERNTDQLISDGIKIARVKTRPTPAKDFTSEIEKPVFLPYSEIQLQGDFIQLCLETIIELSGDANINVVGKQKGGLLEQMMQQKYFSSLLKTEARLKVIDCNDVDLETESKSQGIYLFVSDQKLPDSLVAKINASNNTCYLMQSADKSDSSSVTRFKFLTPIFERIINGNKLIFYKKTINLMVNANFVQVPPGFILDKPSADDAEYQRGKVNFLLYKYNRLSDIFDVLRNSPDYINSSYSRFVFLDEKSSFFNPVDNYFQLHLRKDMKINVSHNGYWGTLKKTFTKVPILTENVFQEQQTPLNKIRCEDVDIKVLGLNLQNLLNPSSYNKLGTLDYYGVTMGHNEVLGLAKLTSDNKIEIDPILMWNRPSHWTEKQAATVPYSYSLAYYLLGIRLLPDAMPAQSIFIHGGHCCFSQALISIALGRNKDITLYTTCFTQLQKEFILHRFPKIKESNIYVLDNCCKFEFDDIYESSGGKGVDLVIDCLDDNGFRECMWQCLGKNARYVYLCNKETSTDFAFGMRMFMRELSILGLNSDMLLDMSEEKKHILAQMVEDGINNGHVQPLDLSLLEGDCSRKRAVQEIISWSRKQGEAKKVLLSMEKPIVQKVPQGSSPSNGNCIAKKNYIIIGNHNNLWYDVLKWLASKGAESVFIITDINSMPAYQQFRLKRLVNNFNNLKITFLGMDHLSSGKKMEESLNQLSESLEYVFYIMPGMENELKLVDEALREHNKKANLVCIGNSEISSLITYQRLKEEFKGLSLVFKKDTVKNRTVINVLDYWMTNTDQKEPVILVDEHEQNEIDSALTDPDILPPTSEDLTDLLYESSKTPCFKEMQSASPPKKFAKELDPVFFFPGFRVSKMRNFISKFPYPSFMAKYPPSVKSYDEIASCLAKELLKYNKKMFSLVAEGWSGPLALKVASLLEKDHRICQIILIDATPSTIRKWTKAINHSEGILSRSISSISKDQLITIDQLKGWKEGVVEMISMRENLLIKEDIKTSMDILIERLQVLESINDFDLKIGAKVHIFTARQNPMINQKEATLILEMCRLQCSHHVVYDTNINDLLDSKTLQTDVRNLVMTEYKSAARMQDIMHMSTLKTIDLK